MKKSYFLLGLCAPFMCHADIGGDLIAGANQLQAAASDNGSLEQIKPQISNMYDQIGAQLPKIDAAIKQNNDALSSIAKLPAQINSNSNITNQLKTSLLSSISNLQNGLNKLNNVLTELRNDIVSTSQEKASQLQKLEDSIQKTRNLINSGGGFMGSSLPSRMRSLAHEIQSAEQTVLDVKKKAENIGQSIKSEGENIGNKIENTGKKIGKEAEKGWNTVKGWFS